MRKSEFREFVKEMFIDLINNDDEVRGIVLEFVKENSNLIVESSAPQVPKEPVDPELYDRLMLVASGNTKKLIHEGKSIQTPNYGTGFKSEKMIREWADKEYTRIGGQWQEANQMGISNDTLSFLSMMDGSDGGNIRSIAHVGNERILKETIKKTGRGEMMALTESGDFDPNNSVDISGILADTARTTLQDFPTSHPEGGGGDNGLSAMAGVKGKEAFAGTPEQAFGASAGNWAALAFQGIDPGGE